MALFMGEVAGILVLERNLKCMRRLVAQNIAQKLFGFGMSMMHQYITCSAESGEGASRSQ